MDAELSLTERIAAGEPAAFEEFARGYGAELRSLCRERAHSPEDADDLYQEALIRIWLKAHTFGGRAALRTWMYRLVANLAIDEQRRRLRVPTPTGSLPEDAREPEWEDTAALGDELRRVLAQLPARYREVAVLSDYCGLPDRDVARLCGIAEATVRTRLHRARKALRGLLDTAQAA